MVSASRGKDRAVAVGIFVFFITHVKIKTFVCIINIFQMRNFSDSAQRTVDGLAVTSRDDSVEEKK